MNGSTSWDRTNYFETLNATDENLKFALELEADRMVNSKIEKPLLDTEMTVVRNEFEMGENSPDRILMQRAPRNRLHLAQLRQAPHRQPLRYRKCADQPIGFVLSKVLPAR